jgi:hypothetical protein
MLRLDWRPHRISKCIDISLDSSKLHRMRCSRQGSMALITIGHPNSSRSRSIPIGPDLCGRHGGVSILAFPKKLSKVNISSLQNLIPRCQRGVRTIRTMVRQKLETGGDRVGELKADAPRNNEFQWDVACIKNTWATLLLASSGVQIQAQDLGRLADGIATTKKRWKTISIIKGCDFYQFLGRAFTHS